MYKEDLALNNLQWLICHKTQSNQAIYIDTAIRVHYMDANKTAGEEARRQLHKNAACNLEQVLAATPHKTPTVRPPASYHENYSSYKLDEPDMQDTAGEAGTNS